MTEERITLLAELSGFGKEYTMQIVESGGLYVENYKYKVLVKFAKLIEQEVENERDSV